MGFSPSVSALFRELPLGHWENSGDCVTEPLGGPAVLTGNPMLTAPRPTRDIGGYVWVTERVRFPPSTQVQGEKILLVQETQNKKQNPSLPAPSHQGTYWISMILSQRELLLILKMFKWKNIRYAVSPYLPFFLLKPSWDLPALTPPPVASHSCRRQPLPSSALCSWTPRWF